MKFISYDLGTGGVKASLYDENLQTLSKSFIEYSTYYPQSFMHEQKPDDWWDGIIASTRLLLEQSKTDSEEITAVALSGHSCVAVPVDSNFSPLLEQVPIWSDTRAEKNAESFFQKVDYEEWYMTTGNGFPSACYILFKLMWYREHMPDMYSKINKIMGSKDYINFRLTGNICTDYSYASSTGAYDLLTHKMNTEYLNVAGISPSIFPEIVPSHHIVGKVSAEAAQATGLSKNTLVACGGVDNACMALGAIGTEEGRIYTSLGSSSWVPVNSKKPVLDFQKKPYVFAHIDENMYTSAFSIFSGGSSFRWIRENLCKDLPQKNAYDIMSKMAESVPIGSGGLIFNPSLAGGTSQDKSIHIRGAFLGLHLGTTREDMIRAAMEGIALNLRMSVNYLQEHVEIADEILFCGGGSKSDIWMQMFADIFDRKILRTNIDQDAASVGAAAICAKAAGLWTDYTHIKELHHTQKYFIPDKEHVCKYRPILKTFEHVSDIIADLGDYMAKSSNK